MYTDDFINQLTDDIKMLNKKIKYHKLYDIRSIIAKYLIKCGIVLDYALPFIFSMLIIMNCYSTNPQIETVKTTNISNGIQRQYKLPYQDKEELLLTHSTNWEINDEGMYERVETLYEVGLEYQNFYHYLLDMDSKNFADLFKLVDKKIIIKDSLNDYDDNYNVELIAIDHIYNEKNNIINQQDKYLMLFLFIVAITSGVGIMIVDRKYLKIKDKLDLLSEKVKPITKENLEDLKELLSIKKSNLDLLNNGKLLQKKGGNHERTRK